MERMIGWVVKAKDPSDARSKLKIVSGPMQTVDGARVYAKLYQKEHPEQTVTVEQRVLDDRA